MLFSNTLLLREWKKLRHLFDYDLKILDLNIRTLAEEIEDVLNGEENIPNYLLLKVKAYQKAKRERKFLKRLITILDRNIAGVTQENDQTN